MKAQTIQGAVAPVTGANRGIGRALTEALLTRGVRKVYATARNPEALAALDTDMSRELAMPKTSPRDVAFAILDGIEAGQEDIFPDPYSVDFARRFASSPKASERQMAADTAAMLSGSTA
jgi:NAD(P)-dependent dehydrogenase (short-subunit alcohol dehydrogenase family)